MPVLVVRDIFLKIIWVWLITARRTAEVETESWTTINLNWDGAIGGAYNGRTRVSDNRVLQQHRPDT